MRKGKADSSLSQSIHPLHAQHPHTLLLAFFFFLSLLSLLFLSNSWLQTTTTVDPALSPPSSIDSVVVVYFDSVPKKTLVPTVVYTSLQDKKQNAKRKYLVTKPQMSKEGEAKRLMLNLVSHSMLSSVPCSLGCWIHSKGSRRSSISDLALLRCCLLCFVIYLFFDPRAHVCHIGFRCNNQHPPCSVPPLFYFPSLSSLVVLASIHRHAGPRFFLLSGIYKQYRKKRFVRRSKSRPSRCTTVRSDWLMTCRTQSHRP